MRLTSSILVAAAVAAALTPPAHADQPPDDYVVGDDETCMEIAVKVLGDRRLLPELHRLNPQLGRLPHALKAGQVLKVPHIEPVADAQLTSKTGDVRVRKPSEADWDAAKRGMDLFRAWRVGAQARAAAEVTFADAQQLYLREHTVVIIYGPERRRARLDAPEAVLERGTLRSRLGELTGKPLKVTTPSAVAELGRGSAVVGVDDAGLSMVANHDGAAIALRGKAGGQVAVKSGMGTRVARGKRPEPPRPLPPAPTWLDAGPVGFVAVGGAATVTAAWTAEPRAASYRFELLRGTAVVAAAELPATVTRFELFGAPPGAYTAQVASLDKDRLEGKPGSALAVTVRGIALAAPGADAPPVAAAVGDDEPIDPARAGAPIVVARGTRIVTDGVTCSAGGAPAAVAVLLTPGPTEVRCTTAEGLALAPITLAVTEVVFAAAADRAAVVAGGTTELIIALTADAPLGDAWQLEPSVGLTVEGTTRTATGLRATLRAAADAPVTGVVRVVDATTQRSLGEVEITVAPIAATAATPPPAGPAPAAGPRWTVGGFAGVTYLPTGAVEGTELGNAALASDVVGTGPAVGARAAYWVDRNVFVEAEVAAIPTRFVGANQSALVLGGHASAGVRMIDRGRFELRALASAGAYALTSDSRDATDDVDPDVGWGLTGAVDIGDAMRLRLDGRQFITADRAGGVTDILEVNLGLELRVGRGR